ncbi:anaerobic ribonucleoside-triphosphate reductase [Escherichia coli]|uniref:Anaerobic ribonucleoside-triphosphate reductase n=1 Tax=Escherichia coli TaxID=562 RepID=A0A376U345_ECOLX|nr:anaerobic ribonucleoside-triphosphate reductase [Escherichia coli]
MVWSSRPTPRYSTKNANKDSKVIPTQRDLLAGIVAKHYARQHLLPRDVVQAHERGDIHYSRSRLLAVLPDVQLHVDRPEKAC